MKPIDNVHIVESHHHVLRHWAELRRDLESPPRLVTLDHHTDTSPAFRGFVSSNPQSSVEKLLSEIEWKNPSSIELAIERLAHDEHITAAIQSDVISSAFVIAQNAMNTDAQVFINHSIACKEVLDRNRVVESDFLEESFRHFNSILLNCKKPLLLEKEFILDIDLDVFNTFKSIKPEDSSLLKNLARNAKMITIAKEPQHVRLCAVDNGLSAEYLLENFIEIDRYC